MRLLPESNSLHKVDMREKIPKMTLFKRIVIIILIIIGSGMIFQWGYDFYTGEKANSSMDYTRVNEKKLEYKTGGSGDFTVIFDGSTGADSSEWKPVADKVEKELGVKTFIYNRRGYGYSDGGSQIAPKDQASDLKILLRKAAANGPYILVGEGYGSLVMTNFAKLYPEDVKGVVLVNPYDESEIKEKGNGLNDTLDLIRKKIEYTGSKCSLTLILDKLGIASSNKEFDDNITGYTKEQFDLRKNQSSYRQAVYNETKNIYDRVSDSQTEGMFKDIPYYILSKNDDNTLKKLGSTDLTFQYNSGYDGAIYSLNDSENVYGAIKKVVETARKIDKKKDTQNN
ncbi:MAG: alpha/beta hydrolase [Clostridium sp.]|uniref:alpha/beta hydrolase n=1 Tax=Clostridium sp. TaxID=1506 RepID=UPI003F3D06F7